MLRVVFMGTPEFAVPTLSEIVAAGHEVVAVYTQPPRPANRGMAEQRSPVHAFAAAAGLSVLTPKTLRDADAQAVFAAHGADIAVVVAYGLILPLPVLAAPRHGCLNLHASALPRWRGAAPIQRAIMAGDTTTAVMVMRMEAGLDTGPVCLAEHIAIGRDETAGELHDRLKVAGASLMVRALAALGRDSLDARPQPEAGVTYAAKITNAETRIDFDRSAQAVHNHVRGLSPVPGAWFEVAGSDGRPERIKVLRTAIVPATQGANAGTVLSSDGVIACAEGAIRLVTIQRPGKRPLPAAEVLRGFPLVQGSRLQVKPD